MVHIENPYLVITGGIGILIIIIAIVWGLDNIVDVLKSFLNRDKN